MTDTLSPKDGPGPRRYVVGPLPEPPIEVRVVSESMTVAGLAEAMAVPVADVVGFAFRELALAWPADRQLARDEIELLAAGFNLEPIFLTPEVA